MATFILVLPEILLGEFIKKRDLLKSYIVNKILENKPNEESHALNILQHMKQSGKLSESEMKDEILGLLVAGHETTANLLVWIFIILAKHPNFRRKVIP